MRISTLPVVLLLLSVRVVAQSENPYGQFGYVATVMPERNESLVQNKFCIINTDTSSSVSMIAIDPENRNIICIDREGLILHVDTLNSFSIARWLSPDPAGQFSSPYVGMGNNAHLSVDPDGAFNLGATLVGSAAGFATGSLVGLAFDKDNWWKYGIAGAAIGGIAGASSGDISPLESGATRLNKFKAEVMVAIGSTKKGFFAGSGGSRKYISFSAGAGEKVTFHDAIWKFGSNVDGVDEILANTIVGKIRGLNGRDDNTVTVKTRVYGNTVVTDTNGNKVVNQESYGYWKSNSARVPKGVTSLTVIPKHRYFVNMYGTLQEEGTYPYFSSRLEIAYAAKDGITSAEFSEKFISVHVKSIHRTYNGGRLFR